MNSRGKQHNSLLRKYFVSQTWHNILFINGLATARTSDKFFFIGRSVATSKVHVYNKKNQYLQHQKTRTETHQNIWMQKSKIPVATS
jgi:hypothetical protein